MSNRDFASEYFDEMRRREERPMMIAAIIALVLSAGALVYALTSRDENGCRAGHTMNSRGICVRGYRPKNAACHTMTPNGICINRFQSGGKIL